MSDIKGSQLKEWAKLLYITERLTQKEVAEKTGKSTVTINKWVKDGEWDRLRRSMLITREAQLASMYMQLEELNTAIMKREEGARFPNSKEADAQNKLANTIKTLETEASVSDIVEVAKRCLNYLRPIDPERARIVAGVFDDFIKDTLKR